MTCSKSRMVHHALCCGMGCVWLAILGPGFFFPFFVTSVFCALRCSAAPVAGRWQMMDNITAPKLAALDPGSLTAAWAM